MIGASIRDTIGTQNIALLRSTFVRAKAMKSHNSMVCFSDRSQAIPDLEFAPLRYEHSRDTIVRLRRRQAHGFFLRHSGDLEDCHDWKFSDGKVTSGALPTCVHFHTRGFLHVQAIAHADLLTNHVAKIS
jgi:hypothetical protein